MPATHFGDSDKARIGDWVIAIGDPFGLGSTVTAGIVSARNRDINAGPYDDFIQTDAPINRGNSGGPLFDMDGNVIGINSAIFSPSGGSVGIGFSIPSNMARDVVAQLRQFGVARRGWIGVRIQQVTDEIAEGMGLPNTPRRAGGGCDRGRPRAARRACRMAIWSSVLTASRSRIRRALPRIVADTPIGKTVNMDVLRKGKKQSYKILSPSWTTTPADKPGKKLPPPAPKTKSKLSQLGLSLAPLDDAARAKYKLRGNVQGVVVSDVDPESPAADKNFRPGDVIVEVQSQPVKSPADIEARVDADVKAGKKVELMLVSRGGEMTYVGLRLD